VDDERRRGHVSPLDTSGASDSAVTQLLRSVARIARSGPILRNVSAAVGVQLCLLVSGSLGARLLGPKGRGYLAILTAWPSAIGQIGAVGISLAATYYLSSGLVGGAELLRVVRRPALVQITSLTLINAAVILGYVAFSGAPVLPAAAVSLALLPGAVCGDYGIAFLLGLRRHTAVTVIRITSAAIYAGGLVVLYVLHSHALIWVVASTTGAAVLAGVGALVASLPRLRAFEADRSVVSKLGLTVARAEMLRFGRKGYIGYLSPVDSFRIDQLVVGFLVSPRALGFYVVGAAFTNFTRLLAVNIGMSATAEIAAQPNEEGRRRAVRRTLLHSCSILTVVSVLLGVVVIPGIPLLFGARYDEAIPVAEILFVAAWLLSMKRVAVDAMRGAGEAKTGAQAEMVNLVVFLAVCGPAGLALGGRGVALALAFSSACGSLVLLRRLRAAGILGSAY